MTEKRIEAIAKLSTLKYLWIAWKHKRYNEHYWIDNSWLHKSPSNGFHHGRRCLFCDKTMYAISGEGWFDEEE